MTPSPFRPLGLLVLVLVALAPLGQLSGQGLEVDNRDLEEWARQRLAVSFDAIASEILGKPGILTPQLELAYGLAKVATELDPKSATAWRRLLQITTALEGDLPDGTKTRRQAIETLAKLDPGDDVMVLRLVLDRIESLPTAQERVEAFESILQPEKLAVIGRDAGARIAYDLALLEQRIGNMNASAERIAQAVQLDPSFPQAADMAAGLFRSVVPTPIDEAELLAIAFTASPGDAVICRSLADLVLASGAYAHADDLFDLVGLLNPPLSPVQDAVTADRILALWGERRIEDARDLANRSIRSRRDRIRRQFEEPLDGTIPPAPEVCLVLAVIEARDGERLQREAAVSTLFESYRFELDLIERRTKLIEENPDLDDEQRSALLEVLANRKVELFADQAWARAWFGWSPPATSTDDDRGPRLSLDDLINGALQGGAIDEEQEKVIRGWAAMEKEDFAQARTLLAPSSQSSPYAEAGIALLDEVEGATKEAARAYLKVFKARPGTLVGLWCRSRLEAILDTSIPETEQGQLMAEMLRATLPESLGRLIRDSRYGVLSLTMEPGALSTAPFEPMMVNLTLTNVSGLKLAIGPDSPIGPTLAIVPDEVVITDDQSATTEDRLSFPVIISLDREFALEPQQSLKLSVDLTSTRLASDFARGSVYGGQYKMRAVVNYKVTPSGKIDAARFGREGLSPVFRINGLVDPENYDPNAVVENMRGADTVTDAKNIAAMLLQVVVPPIPNAEARLTEDSLRFATVDACLALPPVARAWVMSMVPLGSQGTIRLADRLVADGTRESMVLALARFSGTPTSNAIVVGLESDDELIRMMATAAKELATMYEIRRDKSELDVDLGGEEDE